MEAPVAKGVVDEGKASEQSIEVASCTHTNEGIGTVGTDCDVNPVRDTSLAADGAKVSNQGRRVAPACRAR